MANQEWLRGAGRATLVVSALLGGIATTGAAAGADQTTPAELAVDVSLLERAEATYERAEVQKAIDAFDGRVKTNATNAVHFYYLARAYFPMINIYRYQGDEGAAKKIGEEGLKYVREAVRLDEKGNPDAYRLLGDYYGRLSEYQGVFGRMRYGSLSIKNHKKAQEMDPRNALNFVGMGTDKLFAPSAFGGDPKEAVVLFTKAVEMAPSSPVGHVWLGRAYSKLKQFDLAQQHFEKALSLEPRSAFARNEYERAHKEKEAK